MKKVIKVITSGCLAGAIVAGGLVLPGCASVTSVEGYYQYANPWSSASKHYGVKVSVEVQTDEKGDRIRKVSIIDDGEYVQLSDSNGSTWTDENRQVYIDGLQDLLNSYRRMYVTDVLAMKVTTDANRQPTALPSGAPAISGATQSSGRILLAVQDALCNFGYSVCEGSYHYPNAWDASAPHYGIAVRLVMKGNVVKKVTTINSGYTEVSDGWEDKNIWNDGFAALLSGYEGKTKSQILDMTATVSSGGQPEALSAGVPVITGATQGSGRLLLAVQNALDPTGANTTVVCTGEYSYDNTWAPGTKYGIKVNVTLRGNVIQSVSVVDSDYISVSDSWEDKNIWNDGLNDLLSVYKGKTVNEVMQVSVTVADGSDSPAGQPVSVSDKDYIISGATQGSGRLLLAVQNAISRLATVIPDDGGDEEPEEPQNSFEGWDVVDYIDVDATTYAVTGDEVTYNIVTLSNSPATPFEITITVGGDKKIKSFEIDKNGSTGSPWTDLVDSNYVGKDEAFFAGIIGEDGKITDNSNYESNGVTTGATKSNYLCLSAGLFATANYDRAVAEGGNLFEGEYHYANAWNDSAPHYGIKVNVAVVGDKIKSVSVAESDYVEVTDSWDNKDLWISGIDDLLAAYIGLNVADVLAEGVTIDDGGQPTKVENPDLMITGATQGSGRLLLAVQDALKKVPGYSVGVGEYHYANAWNAAAPHYGIRVQVIANDGVVKNVSVVESDYIEVTDSWDNKDLWINGIDDLLAAYSGLNVADVLAESVTVDDNGQPTKVENPDLMIAGATQGSGRLLLAVQNAIKNMSDYSEASGEYHYANAWNATAPHYGIKVNVAVLGSTIVGLSIAESDYVEVTDSWDNKDLWINGIDDMLAAYIGLNVADVLAEVVTVDDGGQPTEVENPDLMITGATQGSGRLLLAVQDALEKIV